LAGASGTKILIADDEAWYAEGVTDALESEGYEVIMEPRMTGTRTLEIMRDPSFHVDILIMDIIMDPGSELVQEVDTGLQTGIKVLEKIREKIKAKNSGFPIICLTAVQDESMLSQIREMDCKVLKKSEVSISDILEAVRTAERR